MPVPIQLAIVGVGAVPVCAQIIGGHFRIAPPGKRDTMPMAIVASWLAYLTCAFFFGLAGIYIRPFDPSLIPREQLKEPMAAGGTLVVFCCHAAILFSVHYLILVGQYNQRAASDENKQD